MTTERVLSTGVQNFIARELPTRGRKPVPLRTIHPAARVACPRCKSEPGISCMTPLRDRRPPHNERREAAR